MKTVVILISSVFPKESTWAGQPTEFVQKINRYEKVHTIRANLNYWLGKEILINSGEAELSLRTWSGAPYRSEQIEIKRIPRINIQLLNFIEEDPEYVKIDNYRVPLRILAKNDGLTVEQFKDWFKGYDLNETMALINFDEVGYLGLLHQHKRGDCNIPHKGICRICGCTWDNACYNPEHGACWWEDETETICSHCAVDQIKNDPRTIHPTKH